jgi:hypothetical protein
MLESPQRPVMLTVHTGELDLICTTHPGKQGQMYNRTDRRTDRRVSGLHGMQPACQPASQPDRQMDVCSQTCVRVGEAEERLTVGEDQR